MHVFNLYDELCVKGRFRFKRIFINYFEFCYFKFVSSLIKRNEFDEFEDEIQFD